jgi:Tfp pilus assembly protein PilF
MDADKDSKIPLKIQLLISVVFMIVLVFFVYSSNVDGPFIFDDSRIQNNPQLHITDLSLKNLIKAGFESSPSTRPVSYITFALNYYFHDFQTRGYHLVNICIHAVTAVLLFLLIKTTLCLPLLQPRYSRYTWLPFAAAIIWAVHPLQTQSVTYIIQRMNSLSALFYILSLYLYAKGRLTTKTGLKWTLFIGAVIAGILALGSKETAATLPFFIFLYEWFFFQDMNYNWLKRQIIPVSLVAGSIFLLVLLYLGLNPLESISASYTSRDFTPLERVLTEFRVVLFYISLLLFPHPARLNLDHHFILSTGLFSPVSTFVSASILLLLSFAALASAKKYRLLSFCILWFLGNLVIESSIIGLELIFEHRNYLPSMLLVLLVLCLIFPVLKHNWLKIAFISFIVLLFSFWTYERNRVWNDKVLLWGDSAVKSPAKARPHNNLGVALKDQGRLDEAIFHFNRTIQLDPEFTEAYNNLANTNVLLGKHNKAIENYKKALKLNPNSPIVHMNIGNILVKRWRLEEARFHYSEALRLDPTNLEARMNLASVQRMLNAQKAKQRQPAK